MPKKNLLVMVLVVLTFGLIAAGCGDDDSTSSTTVTADDTSVSTVTDDTAADTTSDDTSSDTSGAVDADEFYDSCVSTVEGTPAESTATATCQQAKDALEECGEQATAAGQDSAIAACQAAADEAVKQLEAIGG